MKSLLQFLSKYSILLMFIALEVLSLILVTTQNQYQRSAFFSSANSISGWTYTIYSNISSYIGLKKENQVLQEENTLLKNQLTMLENQNEALREGLAADYTYADHDYTFISARVINASVNKNHNYLTLNKGKRDGVRVNMGVVNSDGVVGIVCSVGERFSTVIPAINTDAAISCKVKNSNNMGFLKWDGRDYRYCQLKDMAKHIELNVGDTVLTSGVSSIFPSNIMVGTIKEINTTESDAYHQIVVTLSTDYNQLGYVNIVSNNTQIEQLAQEHEYMD